MSQNRFRIAINKDGHIIKLMQIGFYNNEQGFFVSVPYFEDRQGQLCKSPVDYSVTGTFMARVTASYSATSEVKLSLHEDGFTQFSGVGLTSGRDAEGNPKGLGIFRQPISTIITSGPLIGVNFWGFYCFPELKNNKGNIILNLDDAFYSRKVTNTKYAQRSHIVNIFQIDSKYQYRISENNGQLYYRMIKMYQGKYINLDLTVLPVLDRSYFLGLCIEKSHVEFASDAGYMLASPGGLDQSRITSVLYATYPADIVGGELNSISLDYVKPKED